MRELILYTDGSADPNPGYYGSGVHGYVFEEEVDKPIVIDGWVVTNLGYYNKREIKLDTTNIATVKPISYIDLCVPLGNDGTNNQAEIVGVIEAILIAINLKVDKLTIYTDSSYVCKGMTEWLPKWKRSNYTKSDGGKVSNKELWVKLDTVLTDLKKNTDIDVLWIKAHDGHIGNDKADLLAAIGTSSSKLNKLDRTYTVSDVAKYWKPDICRDPFFFHKRLYFNSSTERLDNVYYLADNDNEDILIGKRKPESSYSVVIFKDKDELIGNIIDYQTKVCMGMNSIFMIKLDTVYNKLVYPHLLKFKELSLSIFKHTFNLTFINRSALTVELNPTFLSLRAIDNFNLLEELLYDVIGMNELDIVEKLCGGTTVSTIDITSYIYEPITTKKSVTIRIKTLISNIVKYIKIPIVHKGKKYKIPLTFGLDIPNRNTLKKLEGDDTKVQLVITANTDSSFTYSTVITKGSTKAICSNYFSNKIYTK